jgi:hypothetical protein
MNAAFRTDRERSVVVGCPQPPEGCGEPIGAPCTRPDGRGGRVPLEHFAAHIPRLKAAGVAHEPVDPRDLEDDGWPHRPHPQIPRAGA